MSTAGLAAGCSASLPKSVGDAPLLSVATGLWPLAQAAEQIGGAKAVVVDVVPAGSDPLHYTPGSEQVRELQGSGLVLEVGGGFQPQIEEAARSASRVTVLKSTIGSQNPYVWLDPATMGHVVGAVADAMAAANPGAAALYQRNARAFEDEVRSIGIDYSSTLASCPGTHLVTPDAAFTTMAAAYGLTDLVVGGAPSAEQVAAAKEEIQAGPAVAVLTEPWVDDTGVEQVGAAAGVKVRPIDTLAGTPTTTVSGQGTYFTQMEHDLGVISNALGCTAEQ